LAVADSTGCIADIQGNSHMLMLDRKSDQIAALINQWLAWQRFKK
jgi:hypothetical protein